jgi:Flp pilus assembly protein TadG
MLMHVGVIALVLMALLTYVVDYGVAWVGRGQAQNAADSGALAGAVSMAFDVDGWTDRTETGPARVAARQMALSNVVWGAAPDVNITTDVVFTNLPADRCPVDANGRTPCIRVDVYRNQARGNALPSIFGGIVGLTETGVKATATARVAVADASRCMKPWAIPDKWDDNYDVTGVIEDPPQWTDDDEFETHSRQGNTWTPLVPPDVYTAPTATSPGTGFTLAADEGRRIVLKHGNPQDAIAPGWFFPVRLPRADGGSQGGDDYRENIASCNGLAVGVGDTLQSENGNMIGPTRQGVEDLIALDPYADWAPTTNSVIGSCAQASTPCASISPRVVAIPVFDTGAYFAGKMNGQVTITVVNILGFFIDDMDGDDVIGYLTEAPGLALGSGTIDPRASFLSQIQLVR